MKPQSIQQEYLIASASGAYSSSTIMGCNTRKYHGIFIAPQPDIDDDNHLFVSTVDETIRYKGRIDMLGTHKYPGTMYPEGYKYVKAFNTNPIPEWLIETDGLTLSKEILFAGEILMIKYNVINADEKLQMQLAPLIAFRNVNQLVKASFKFHQKINIVNNGLSISLHDGYSELFMQTSDGKFTPAPDWYYNIEYPIEQERGYDYAEDLYCPGIFEVTLKKGSQFIFSAGLNNSSPRGLKLKFNAEIRKKRRLESLEDCLHKAADEFIITIQGKTYIKAGYHWFGSWGRDTFIALPGLTLPRGKNRLFKAVIDTALKDLKNGLLPNTGKGKKAAYNSADASLWFIWALQQYAIYNDDYAEIWKEYGTAMASILKNYKKGTGQGIKMDTDGLIYITDTGHATTWMDAMADGKPVIARSGKCVDINALWYNAICFCLEAAILSGDRIFFRAWQDLPETIKFSFKNTFWDEAFGYLADYVFDGKKNMQMRPNQLFAVSLPCSPLPVELHKSIIDTITAELLTPRGLRTLNNKDPEYKGIYLGSQPQRDLAYHQGTVWPWLLGAFTEAMLKQYKEEAIADLENIFDGFYDALDELCLNHIPEIYDGDAPHKARGAVSQAWSVAELLRMKDMLVKQHAVDVNITHKKL